MCFDHQFYADVNADSHLRKRLRSAFVVEKEANSCCHHCYPSGTELIKESSLTENRTRRSGQILIRPIGCKRHKLRSVQKLSSPFSVCLAKEVGSWHLPDWGVHLSLNRMRVCLYPDSLTFFIEKNWGFLSQLKRLNWPNKQARG